MAYQTGNGDHKRSIKIHPGRVVITATALTQLPQEDVLSAIHHRHVRGDWGEVDEHDRQENERSLQDGGRLLSVYYTEAGTRFYVITEHDRSVTTVLLPEDYQPRR